MCVGLIPELETENLFCCVLALVFLPFTIATIYSLYSFNLQSTYPFFFVVFLLLYFAFILLFINCIIRIYYY